MTTPGGILALIDGTCRDSARGKEFAFLLEDAERSSTSELGGTRPRDAFDGCPTPRNAYMASRSACACPRLSLGCHRAKAHVRVGIPLGDEHARPAVTWHDEPPSPCDAKDEVELALHQGMEMGTSGMSKRQAAIDMNAAFPRCVVVEFTDKGDKRGRCRPYSRCTGTSDESSDYIAYFREQPAALNQDRACVSGQTCVIDAIYGPRLTKHDAFVVLDTCATAAALPRFPNGGRATEVLVQDATHVTLTSQHTDFMGRYDVACMAFGGVVWTDDDELYCNRSAPAEVTAQGGHYRICWCAASHGGSLDENFLVDVGKVTIAGPRPLGQLRPGISGRHCCFGVLTGHADQDGDRLLGLDACGDMDGTIPRITHPTDTLANVVVLTSSGSYAAWEPRMITSTGGHYKLCWCAHRQLCSQTEHSRTDIGMVTVIGPAPLQQMRTCISGQTCAFGDLTDENLANDDRILALDTCIGAGDEALTLPRFPSDARSVEARSSGSSQWTYGLAVTARGGQYRLGWCGAQLPADNALFADGFVSEEVDVNGTRRHPCACPHKFRMYFGTLRLVGPQEFAQDRTCGAGQACNFGPPHVEGWHSGDQVVVLDAGVLGAFNPPAEWTRGHCGRTP